LATTQRGAEVAIANWLGRHGKPPCPRQPQSRDDIRAIFLRHGFTINPGNDDLKEYVYEAAQGLEAAIRAKGER